MKTARVLYNGAVHSAIAHEQGLLLADGRVLNELDVIWLPPVEVGTIFALGLNYADHSRELGFKPPNEPLVFMKGPNTLLGHDGQTPRPKGVKFMHYECELVVVIGQRAQRIPREQALQYVAGYTIANDYAVRDYLENFYRPNLRVKNRDACTPLGPWLSSVDEVNDPQNLALVTRVNGLVTQRGSTRDMVFSVAYLIEYLSSFMTLEPGDIILTGTPDGVVDCPVGSVVECEIEGLGTLRSCVVDDKF